MIKVYISGPYTTGGTMVNVKNAIDAAEKLSKKGFAPFIPHLFCLWEMAYPHEYAFWMRMDLAFLDSCDILLRLPGESPGADREVAMARKKGMRVYHSIDDICRFGNVAE